MVNATLTIAAILADSSLFTALYVKALAMGRRLLMRELTADSNVAPELGRKRFCNATTHEHSSTLLGCWSV